MPFVFSPPTPPPPSSSLPLQRPMQCWTIRLRMYICKLQTHTQQHYMWVCVCSGTRTQQKYTQYFVCDTNKPTIGDPTHTNTERENGFNFPNGYRSFSFDSFSLFLCLARFDSKGGKNKKVVCGEKQHLLCRLFTRHFRLCRFSHTDFEFVDTWYTIREYFGCKIPTADSLLILCAFSWFGYTANRELSSARKTRNKTFRSECVCVCVHVGHRENSYRMKICVYDLGSLK